MRDHPTEPLYTLGEEIAHAVTHGLGLVLSIAALVTLVTMAALHGDARHVAGSAIFGVTLVLLYAASTLYHAIPAPRAKQVFRQLDHAAIFLLIAGTYTPFMLIALPGSWGWTLLAAVWGLALTGIVLQFGLPRAARRVAVPLHLAMGWMILIAFEPLARSLHPDGLLLLALGGLAYTSGVVFYAWQRLPFNHAVWHVFVMAGSGLHVSCVAGYLIP
jgi:hemolysin III